MSGVFQNYIKDSKGNIYLNAVLPYARGAILALNQDRSSVTTAASSTSAPVIFEGPQEATSLVTAFMGLHRAADNADVQRRLEVLITDVMWRRRLMNRAVLANHVFGSNLQQFEIMETLLLQGQQILSMQFTNNSALGESNFTPAARILKLQNASVSKRYADELYNRQRVRKQYLYPYWFTLDDGVITLTASQTRTYFMSNTYDVELAMFLAIGSAWTAGSAGDTQELFTASIKDAKTQDPLQSGPITFNTGFGNARFPYPFPTPLIIPANTQVAVELTNLVTDGNTNVALTLHGVANYTGKGLSLTQDKGQVVEAPLVRGQFN